MRIAVDTDDFPAARRQRQWRELMCDTYLRLDCKPACDDFRFVVDGYAAGEYSIIRETSAGHESKRRPSHVRKDGIERIYIEILLTGRARMTQGARTTVLEPGMVAFTDSTRPFETSIGPGNDSFWISAPKQPLFDRLSGLEDKTAVAFAPSRSIHRIAFDIWEWLGKAEARNCSSEDTETTVSQMLELFATTVMLSALEPGATRLERGFHAGMLA